MESLEQTFEQKKGRGKHRTKRRKRRKEEKKFIFPRGTDRDYPDFSKENRFEQSALLIFNQTKFN